MAEAPPTQPPSTQPLTQPLTQPPQPPSTQPPNTQPPNTQPPNTQPPMQPPMQPPDTQPTQPPTQPPTPGIPQDIAAHGGGGEGGGDESDEKAAARISSDAKADLHKYFSDANWPRNKTLPKENADTALDSIIKKYKLKRSQASRQLSRWKGITYENKQVTLILEPEDIEHAIYESMSVDNWEDFVIQFLDDLHDGKDVQGSIDATNYCQSVKYHTPGNRDALSVLSNNYFAAKDCIAILADYLTQLTELAGSHFPKTARDLGLSEVKFLVAETELRSGLLQSRWKQQYQWIRDQLPTSGAGDKSLDELGFAHFGSFLFQCLYRLWSRMLVEDNGGKVEIPTEDLVGKYALEVVYYVAGWTLQRTSLALGVAEVKKGVYKQFAASHSIEMEEAREANLPSSLVELRRKKKLFFVTESYFDFIRFIESIYLHNLTLKMMMAHSNGDLAGTIHDAIITNETVHARFSLLFPDGSSIDEGDRPDILSFVLERYVHMRGCWFVRYMKKSQNKSAGESRAEAAPTRTKVSHCHVQSKSKANGDEAEKDLYEYAAKQVIEFEDEGKSSDLESSSDEGDGFECDPMDIE